MAHGMARYSESIEKEQTLLDYLYDEGPTTTDELIERTSFQPDWLRKSLTTLRLEGKIINETIRGKSYWMLPV